MPQKKYTRSDNVFATVGAVVLTAKVVADGSNIPFIGVITGVVGEIVELAQFVKDNQEDCKSLAIRCQDLLKAIVDATAGATLTSIDDKLSKDLEELGKKFESIKTLLLSLRHTSLPTRIFHRSDIKDKIRRFKEDLDSAFQVFQVRDAISQRLLLCGLKNSQSSGKTETESVDKFMLLRDPPSRPSIFFGRDDYVNKAVREIIGKHPVRFTILGPGGIGKTSVVKAILDHDDIRTTFNDHRYFIACDAFIDANAMVLAIYQIVIGSSSTPSLTSLLAFLRSQRESLLVLDNFETMWDVQNQDAIKDVINKLFGVKSLSLLLTMRGTKSPEAFHWSSLDLENQLPVLDIKSAKEAFLATCPDWVSNNDLSKLLSQLDCLPLAVFIVSSVASMMEYTPAQILANISTYLKTDRDDRFNSIKASVSLSLNSYSMARNPQCLELLKIIAYLPGGAAGLSLKKISNISDCEKYLAILVKFGLAYKIGHGRYNMLSPVRYYFLEDYPINRKLKVQEDIFQFFFELCRKAQNLQVYSSTAKEELTKEKDNCFKVLSDALIIYDKDNNCLRAVYDFSVFLYWTVPSQRLFQLAEKKIEKCDDPQLKAYCLQCSGDNARMLNNYNEAKILLSQAKTEFESIGDRLGVAQCLRSLGNIARMLNDYKDAMTLLSRAKTEFKRVGDRAGVAQCLRSHGDIALMLNDHNAAWSILSQAKSEFERIGDRVGTAQCLQSLGNIARMSNDYEKAKPLFSKAQTEHEAIGDKMGSAQCLQSLGNIARMSSQYEEARSLLSKAKTEFKSIGDRLGVAQCLRSLGNISRMLKEYKEAKALLSQAKTEFERVGDGAGAAQCLQSQGDVVLMLKDYNTAKTLLSQAKSEFERVGDRLGIAQCLQSLGNIARMLGDDNKAISLLSQAKTEFDGIGDSLGIAQCLRSLGDIARLQKSYNKAKELFSQAKPEFENAKNKLGIAECLECLGKTAMDSKDYASAQQFLLQAEVMFVEIGIPSHLERCRTAIVRANRLSRIN